MKIEELISAEALAQFDTLYDKLLKNVAVFEQLTEQSIALNKGLSGATSIKETTAAIDKLAKSEEALTASAAEIRDLQEKLKKSFADNANAAKQFDKALLESKAAKKAYNDELKREVDLETKVAGSRGAAVAAIKALRAEVDKLDLTNAKGVARQQELNRQIDKYNLFLTQTADKQTAQSRNVGNYSGAVQILQGQLAKVVQRLEQYNKAGNVSQDVIDQLNKEQGLLVSLLERQEQGFSRASQEIRENREQLLRMEQAGLQATDGYRQLSAATATLIDDTSDLATALKNAAPDDVAFNAAADAARGLVGIYGLAKSGAAAFGIENEALEETMVKLQAAETALQSIEAIRALFKKENAVRQAINIGLQKIEIFQTNLETAAQRKNIVVRYLAIAAQKALNAVMAISAPQLAIIVGALTLAVVLFSSFSTATKKAELNLEMFNAEVKHAIAGLDEYNEVIDRTTAENVAKMQAEFRSAQEIRAAERAGMQKQLQQVSEILADRAAEFREAARIEEELAKKVRNRTIDDDEKKRLEQATESVKQATELRKREVAISTKLEIDYQNSRKATTEELAKDQQNRLDIRRIELTRNAAIQQAIVQDETKSYDERIAAQKKFNNLQLQLIQNDLSKQLKDPTLKSDPTRFALIEKQASDAKRQATIEGNRAVEDLQKQSNERQKKANLEMFKILAEESIRAQEAIVENESAGYDKRLTAAYDAFRTRQQILRNEHELEIQDKTKTAEEIRAIELKYAAESNALIIEYGATQLRLLEANQEAMTEAVEREQKKRQDLISGQGGAATAALNQQFAAGLISIGNYNKQREKIERETELRILQEQVNVATGRLLITKDGTAERVAAEKEYYDAVAEFQDKQLAKEKEDAQKLADVRKQAFGAGIEAFESLILGTYDKEKNAVQAQIDALELKKQKDIEVANQTIVNEQDKAAAITTIEARANAAREQLELKKRRLDYEKARTERALTIGRIIAETARAVVEALPNYPLAVATGLLGGLQLAKVLATPLPAFEDGTKDAPGGWALVGEKRSEYVVTPKGDIIKTPSTPTVMNVPKHSIIYPNEKQFLERTIVPSQVIERNNNNDHALHDLIGRKLDKLNKNLKNKPQTRMESSMNGFLIVHQYGTNVLRLLEEMGKI